MNHITFYRSARRIAALLLGIISQAVVASAAAPAEGPVPPPLAGESLIGKDDLIEKFIGPVLQKILASSNGNELTEFAKAWHVEPKFLRAQGSTTDGVFGFDYDFKKAVENRVYDETSDHPMGVSWTVDAKGSVAVDAKKNPNNLLESGTTLHVFQGRGGLRPRDDGSGKIGEARSRSLMASVSDPEFKKQRGAAWRSFEKDVTELLRPQFFWDLQGHATLESDQQFHKKAWTYGCKLALVARDWREKSELGKFNVLDYPFAATRSFFDKEDFTPSGRTFPSLILGIDQVDPSKDGDRLKIDPRKDTFARLRAELSFKTRALRWEGQNLYVHAAYRYFKEQGASAAIGAAKLDRFSYFVVRLDLPGAFFVSFTDGRLPFDRKSDQVYALGWMLHE